MADITSLELSQELYRWSHWGETNHYWFYDPDRVTLPTSNWSVGYASHPDNTIYGGSFFPAYDLGYLLRKLPYKLWVGHIYSFQLHHATDRSWSALYLDAADSARIKGLDYEFTAIDSAGTPEDAVCKLAIALCKRRVINPLERKKDNELMETNGD